MSEKSKGDTSSMIPTPSRIVKNPLLSASATGLSFDDFPNKPHLLPAAPPVILAPPPSMSPSPPIISTSIISRESKSLVTVGQTSVIDNETLSEINLNATVDDTQPARIDTNSNLLLDPNSNLNSDSIFNQAASSFSALPSVASSVLSTFSKRLYSGSTSRERTPLSDSDLNTNPVSQLDIQPTYIQQQQHQQHQQQQLPTSNEPLAPPPSFAVGGGSYFAGVPPPPPPTQFETLNKGPPSEPPKFYTPTEVPALPVVSGPPPTAVGQNTYRLSAKKKTYAPIPGFSEQSAPIPTAPTLDPQTIIAPIEQTQSQSISYGYQDPFTQTQQQQSYQYKEEERKGGIFSNLMPTAVFQNLTGLVQSAAGTIAQTVKPTDPVQQPTQHQYQPLQQTSLDNNYYGGVNPLQSQLLSQPTFSSTSPPPNLHSPANVGSNQQGVTTPTNFFTPTPYPSVAQQEKGGLPTLPSQNIFTTPLVSETHVEKLQGISEIPPPIGFDQFLSGSTSASSQLVNDTPSKLLPVGVYEPNRPPSQIDPLRPPSQSSIGQSSVQLFDPNQPLSAPNLTPTAIFSQSPPPTQSAVNDPLRPTSQSTVGQSSIQFFNPSQPLSAPNLTPAAILQQKRPPSIPQTTDSISQPSVGLTPVQFFDPTKPLAQIELTPTPTLFDTTRAATDAVILSAPQPIVDSVATQFYVPSELTADPNKVSAQNLVTSVQILNPNKPSKQPDSSLVTEPLHPPTQRGIAPALSDPLYSSTSTSQATGDSTPIQFFNPNTLPASSTFFEPIRPLPQTLPSEPQNTLSQSIQFFDPSRPPVAQPSTVSTFSPLSTQQPASHISPVSAVQPPTASGQTTTFRLQKGTRHYKNPLSSAETTPSYGQVPHLISQSVAHEIFNPFASNVAVSAEHPALFTPPSEQKLTEPQSVPLFVHETRPVVKEDVKAEYTDLIQSVGTTEALPQIKNKAEEHSVEVKSYSSSAHSLNPITENLTNSVTPTLIKNDKVEKIPSLTEIEETSTVDFIAQTIEAFLSPTLSEEESFELAQIPLSNEPNIDRLEATLQKLALPETEISENQSSSITQAANFLPPPPQVNTSLGPHSNPYRKELTAAHPIPTTQPSLANFFAPNSPSVDFNFFPSPQQETIAADESAKFCSATSISGAPIQSTANFFNQPLQENQAQKTEVASADPEISKTVELVSETFIAPPAVFKELLTERAEQHPEIAPPLGFDTQTSNLIHTELKQEAEVSPEIIPTVAKEHTEEVKQQTETLNSFSNFFKQTSEIPRKTSTTLQQSQTLPNLSSFFDTLGPQQVQTTVASIVAPNTSNIVSAPSPKQPTAPQQPHQPNEEQLIQNFFNNPPPKEASGVGDLNYDLVHSGLAVKNLHTRSLTPFSNLVEPPSSSCSEFSELSSSIVGLKQNPSPLSLDYLNKSNIDANKSTTTLGEEIIASDIDKPVEQVAPLNDLVKNYEDLPDEILFALRMANSTTSEKAAPAQVTYKPAVKHWFYKRPNGTKYIWTPFSHYDSALLETTLTMGPNAPNIVAVEGGRYDVNINERTKTPVYWDGLPFEVRRCSWFYKAVDSRYVPYEEDTAELLESEYKKASESAVWHKKIIISQGEQVVFHGPTVIVHFQQQQNLDAWGGSSQTTTRPRVVKRDLDDFIIDPGESQRVDHLLFMVHGIGAACDLKMRTVEEVVEEFRTIARQLVISHYKNSCEMGLVGRVEVLPISWHSHLHSGEMGIDVKLKSITLESIPKLRNFTNDTLLDVLFYTSPIYCQKIMNTVASSMNSVYIKYRERHPEFSGGVSLAGHSLGSLILFDLLCHQTPLKESEEQNMENPDQQFLNSETIHNVSDRSQDVALNQMSYTMGPAGTGQPSIHYTQLIFQPKKFFALGSPIGMFVTIRGIDNLGLDFRLPTCSGFYNIFHPFDPVAYRIEALVNPDMSGIRPVLIPHHKGRKRMHLELKETMTRVGADLKQRFLDTFKSTLESVNFLAPSTSSKNKAIEVKETMEKEVDEVLEMQMKIEQQKQREVESSEASVTEENTTRRRTDSTSTNHSESELVEIDFPMGKLNDSKRIDYVLQEAPLEFFNEYLFALSSHVCYWESSDTILFVIKEIYTGLGVSPDSQVPQQSMTIERPSGSSTPTI